MPQQIVNSMLTHSFYLKPGRDTSAPKTSVNEYRDSLRRRNHSFDRKSVYVVGAGGNLALGVFLLEAGAARVTLQDPFAPNRDVLAMRQLSEQLLEKYFVRHGNKLEPANDNLRIFHGSVAESAQDSPLSEDVICSSSVLEHVRNLEQLVSSMRALIRPSGRMVHFVDLQDHYFKYPFEMLSYSSAVWNKWLDAGNHLNRLRLHDYQRIFNKHFPETKISTISALPEEFSKAKARIRPEFLTGDDSLDAAAIIKIES